MLYQARFREQEIQLVKNEIETLISQIEVSAAESPAPVDTVQSYRSVSERLLGEFIPDMLDHRLQSSVFQSAVARFRKFLDKLRN